MNPSSQTISPLRQRMIDDMTLRKLSPKTQDAYIRSVIKLTRFLRRSPDAASPEDLRRFQLHLASSGVSNISINATITGLRFFFETTLDDHQALCKMSTVREPRKLPVVLSTDEVRRLLEATTNVKYKAALATAYGAGLRASEVTHLKVTDIDSQRMMIRVEQGKGNKDRNAMLPPALLVLLRHWWRVAQAQRRMLKGGWLFPGQNPVNPLSTRQLRRAMEASVTLGSVLTSAANCLASSFTRSVSSPSKLRLTVWVWVLPALGLWTCSSAPGSSSGSRSARISWASSVEYGGDWPGLSFSSCTR